LSKIIGGGIFSLFNTDLYMCFFRVFISLVIIVFSFNLNAQQECRPKVGLVLSGGGARGFAHVGVLKILEEQNIPIDYIAGTSMGAIIGGFYAMGYSADEIEKMILTQDWDKILSDYVDRKYIPLYDRDEKDRYALSFPIKGRDIVVPEGVSAGQNVMKLLSKYTILYHNIHDFTKLQIPFACVAADVVEGEEFVMREGSLSIALRASMSIPTIFSPIDYEDKLLVDGGMRNNLPADVVKDMGADIIIGIDLQQPNKKKQDLNNMYTVFSQGMSFLGLGKYFENLKIIDIYLKPDVARFSISDFAKGDSLICQGYKDAKTLIPQLKRLKGDLGAYEVKKHSLTPVNNADSIYINNVNVLGLKGISKKAFFGRFNVKPNAITTYGSVEDGIDRLYASFNLRSVSYEFEGVNKENLNIYVKEKSSNRFNIGVHYDTYNDGSLLLNNTFNNLLGKSSRLSLDAKLGKNYSLATTYSYNRGWKPGFRANFEWTGFDFYEFKDNERIARLDATALRLDLNTNTIISDAYSFGVGVRSEYYYLENNVGESTLPKNNFFVNYYTFLRMDTHEKHNYPRSGMSLYAELRAITDNGYSIDNGDPYYMLYFKFKKPIALTSSLTIIPSVYASGAINTVPEEAFAANTFWGGMLETSYFYNQIPFIGYSEMTAAYKSAIVLRADLRYEVFSRNYLVLKWNVGKSSDFLNFTNFEYLHGGAIHWAYDSLIGPLEIGGMVNSGFRNYSLYVNLGYYF